MFVWAKIPSLYNDGYELSDEVFTNANVFITPGGIFGTAGERLYPGEPVQSGRKV